MKRLLSISTLICLILSTVVAQEKVTQPDKVPGNPFIRHMFTADPSAHVFEGKMYVYPSHDRDNPTWFNMRDYHVFSSTDLSNWEDHGVALDVDDVPWAKEYMWAPDCAYKDGWYYFYFPAKDTTGNFKIGVATSQSPSGPFIPEPEPIPGSFSVDPNVFIDDDGQAYLYFGGAGHGGSPTPWVAKLDESMKKFNEEPTELKGIKPRRSIAADYLHFNDDASIRTVVQTRRGIDGYDGLKRIEAENYGESSGAVKKECAEGGFQVVFDHGDQLVFNNIDFDDNALNTMHLRISSQCEKGILKITTLDGQLLDKIKFKKTNNLKEWNTHSQHINAISGLQDIKIEFVGKQNDKVFLNWIEFLN